MLSLDGCRVRVSMSVGRQLEQSVERQELAWLRRGCVALRGTVLGDSRKV